MAKNKKVDPLTEGIVRALINELPIELIALSKTEKQCLLTMAKKQPELFQSDLVHNYARQQKFFKKNKKRY